MLVRIVSTKRTRKKGNHSLKKLTFSQRACWAASWRIIANKIKLKLVSRKKLHRRVVQMVLYRAMYGDFTHLINWSRWRPASGGGSWCRCFFLSKIYFCVLCCGVLCWERRDAVVFLWWRCDSPLVTHMDLKKTTYEGLSMIYETRHFFLSKSSLPT